MCSSGVWRCSSWGLPQGIIAPRTATAKDCFQRKYQRHSFLSSRSRSAPNHPVIVRSSERLFIATTAPQARDTFCTGNWQGMWSQLNDATASVSAVYVLWNCWLNCSSRKCSSHQLEVIFRPLQLTPPEGTKPDAEDLDDSGKKCFQLANVRRMATSLA